MASGERTASGTLDFILFVLVRLDASRMDIIQDANSTLFDAEIR